jgi:hypothetical protein
MGEGQKNTYGIRDNRLGRLIFTQKFQTVANAAKQVAKTEIAMSSSIVQPVAAAMSERTGTWSIPG